jgi:hypothetical protein
MGSRQPQQDQRAAGEQQAAADSDRYKHGQMGRVANTAHEKQHNRERLHHYNGNRERLHHHNGNRERLDYFNCNRDRLYSFNGKPSLCYRCHITVLKEAVTSDDKRDCRGHE